MEFKRELAVAACVPGISVAKLAFEHGVNANLLFKWRREYRAGKFGVPDTAHVAASTETEDPPATEQQTAVTLLPVQAVPAAQSDVLSAAACIEVVFRSATVRICGTPESALLRVVLDALARRS